jgi:hypothetical protein
MDMLNISRSSFFFKSVVIYTSKSRPLGAKVVLIPR